MDAQLAARLLRENFSLVDGTSGRRAGDWRISLGDLQKTASMINSTDPSVRALAEAAKFFLDNRALLNRLDTAQKGGKANGQITGRDLDAFQRMVGSETALNGGAATADAYSGIPGASTSSAQQPNILEDALANLGMPTDVAAALAALLAGQGNGQAVSPAAQLPPQAQPYTAPTGTVAPGYVTPPTVPMDAQTAIDTLVRYRGVFEGASGQNAGDNKISVKDLQAMAGLQQSRDPAMQQLAAAAQYFLSNPALLNSLDTAALGGKADNRIGFRDLSAFQRQIAQATGASPSVLSSNPVSLGVSSPFDPGTSLGRGIAPVQTPVPGNTGLPTVPTVPTGNPNGVTLGLPASGNAPPATTTSAEQFLMLLQQQQGLGASYGPLDADSALALLKKNRKLLDGASGKGAGDKLITLDDLRAAARMGNSADPAMRELAAAAQFFLDHEALLNSLDTAHMGGNADGKIGFGDLNAFDRQMRGAGADEERGEGRRRHPRERSKSSERTKVGRR